MSSSLVAVIGAASLWRLMRRLAVTVMRMRVVLAACPPQKPKKPRAARLLALRYLKAVCVVAVAWPLTVGVSLVAGVVCPLFAR